MKLERQIMGMPVRLDVPFGKKEDLEKVFSYFLEIDRRFSPFKVDSEVSQINKGNLNQDLYSDDMQEVLRLAQITKRESNGYFDVWRDEKLDPSGLVKGWAIHNAALLIRELGYSDFYVEAGGDIEVGGKNNEGKAWRIGIRNPFREETLVDVVCLSDRGIATSGTYLLGEHIYNPHDSRGTSELTSLSVIGPNVYEADRFATAAFAMGKEGLWFVENRSDLEALMIDAHGNTSETGNFGRFRC